MANNKSTKKRIRTSADSQARNANVRSRMRTFMKNARIALEQKDAEAIKTALPAALSEIDRAAKKGVIHKNSAARKKSSLQRQAVSAAQ